MNKDIQAYLTKKQTELERSKTHIARFSLPALKLLMISSAYKAQDWQGLKQLADDLKTENLSTIRLARKYPDVFHPNVIRSRQAENRIYDAVIKLLEKQETLQAA